jgi:hypothetical protein
MHDVHGGINGYVQKMYVIIQLQHYARLHTVIFRVVTWRSLVLVLCASFYNSEGIIMGALREVKVRHLPLNILLNSTQRSIAEMDSFLKIYRLK